MPERSKATSRRLFRRIREQFKEDLGVEKLTRADKTLIDQCALLTLRARQMRDDVLAGEKVVSDEDIVRCTNAAMRAMKLLQERKGRDSKPVQDWGAMQDEVARLEQEERDAGR